MEEHKKTTAQDNLHLIHRPINIQIYRISQKCIHTLIAESSILKIKCILINTDFIIIQSVSRHLLGHPIFSLIWK